MIEIETEQKEAPKHFYYGGSSIERTIACPGSVAAIKAMGSRPAGPAAERGTRIHKWLEKYLTGNYAKDAKKRGLSKQDKEEAAIAAAAGLAIKEVGIKHGFTPADFLIEKCLPLKSVSEKAGGTPDVYAYKSFGKLLVVDLKTGNRQVGAEENWQMMFYAQCALDNMPSFDAQTVEEITLVIVQPAQEAPFTCAIREWSMPAADLAGYVQAISNAIQTAETNPDHRVAGDHCEEKYCDARTTCNVYRAWLNERSTGLFAAVLSGEKVKALDMSGEDLAKLLSVKSALNSLIKLAEEQAIDKLRTAPDSVPGYALEDKLSNRGWAASRKQVTETAKELGLTVEQITSLISPAQFEELLKAKGIDLAKMPPTSRVAAGQGLVKAKAANKANPFEEVAPPPAAMPALSLDALL